MQIHEKTSTLQKIILVIFGLFLCSVLLEGGLRIGGFILLSQEEYRNRGPINQKETYRIMCLGESTTFLGGGNSYPRQLERILNQRNSGIKFKVINKGVGGTTSTNIVAKLESNIKKYNPDIIIVMMGINDTENTVAYADIHSNKTVLFLKSFRIYKLAKLLQLHIIHKFKEKKLVEAEETHKKALEITTINDRAYINLTDYNQEQGKLVEVEELFKKALEINPKNDGLYINFAQYFWDQGKLVEAEETLKKALELNPKKEGAYINLADYYRKQGKLVEAEEMFKKALEINPKNDGLYISFAQNFWDQRKLVEAEETLKKVLEINPNYDLAYNNLADYYLEHGKLVEAEETLKKALEINPKNDYAYIIFAQYLWYQGKLDEAVELFKKALEINPRYDLAYIKLADYYRKQGKLVEVEELFKRAKKTYSEDDAFYYQLSALLNKKKKKGKAADGYSQKTSAIDTGWYKHVTIQNYRILKEIVTKKGIKLVFMQYPVRSVEPLKKIFKSEESLVYVDNERIFKEAIARENYDKYFIDKSGDDFGHCTVKGDRLLAENAANVILKEFF